MSYGSVVSIEFLLFQVYSLEMESQTGIFFFPIFVNKYSSHSCMEADHSSLWLSPLQLTCRRRLASVTFKHLIPGKLQLRDYSDNLFFNKSNLQDTFHELL